MAIEEHAKPGEGPEKRYNIFRWYRAGWGRYTQADPIGLASGSNLYSYVDDNPVGYMDIFGLATVEMRPIIFPGVQQPIWKQCNAYSCTEFRGAIDKCDCTCSGTQWRMQIHAWIRPFMFLPNARFNPEIPRNDRRGHEQQHIDDIQQRLQAYLTWAEGDTFETQSRCNSVCSSLKWSFDSILADKARQSNCALDGVCR